MKGAMWFRSNHFGGRSVSIWGRGGWPDFVFCGNSNRDGGI